MKKTLVIAGSLLVAAATVLAGPENMILQHARTLSDQNNARQGVAPAQAPAPARAAAPAPPPADPAQPIIDKLTADLTALETQPDDAHKQQLAHDLTAAVHGPKPADICVTKLANDLSTALSGHLFLAANLVRLARCVNVLMNTDYQGGIDKQAVANELESLLQSGGTLRGQVTTVSSDLKIVAADEQAAASKQ